MDRKREDRTEKSALKMFERIGNWIDKWRDRIIEFLLMSGVIVLMSYMFFLITILMIVIIKKYI